MPLALQATAPVVRRWIRRLAYVVGAIVLLGVVAWLAVPPIVRAQLESRLTEALGRQTTVEAVAFDPLRLRLTIRKLAIADRASSAPLFTFDELVADVAAASIWHRAPVLDAVKLVRPSTAARARPGQRLQHPGSRRPGAGGTAGTAAALFAEQHRDRRRLDHVR